MRNYNITVHILFWIIIALLLSAAVLIIFLKVGLFELNLPFFEKAELQQKEEKIIVREVKEVEREVDWFYFVASGYSGNDPAQGTNSTTATGIEVREGIIAVDPDIIPLGTEVEIKDMGVFTAEDTGGKIKGNRLDIYFDSKKEAKNFGRRGVWVRMLGSAADLAEGDLYESVPMYDGESPRENLSAYGY
ncbi:MAG: 3D domain-containing protein [Actinomycetota bacterium]|nr:3D domain-containing protein [Actinomycetota bacterium]